MKAAIIAASLLIAVGSASAQGTPAEKANQLNDEGKELFGQEKYGPAAKKFEAAIILSPEGRFYFNLCFTYYFLERYQDALEQCRAVQPNGGDGALIDKTNKLIAEIEKRLPPPANDPNTGDPNTGDPNTGDPNTGNPNTGDPNTSDPNTGDPSVTNPGTAGPPPSNPFITARPRTNPYKWSLGAEFGPLANLSVGSDEFYENGAQLRLFANFIVSDARQLGIQPYFQFTNISSVEPSPFDPLRMFDLGVAAFLHRQLGNSRFYWTPQAGIHVSIQEPTSDPDTTFVALGARAEVQFAFVFGSRGQHALTLSPSLNLYGSSSAPSDSIDRPEDFELDKASATFAVALGYQLRFATPFGSSALINLE